jgi:Chalcone isomerase-like
MRTLAVSLLAVSLAVPALSQEVTEAKSGTKFAAKVDDMSLLGAGLRVKKILFTFKAYAIGFYVADSALSGPLAAYKGKTDSPAFYKELIEGDFKKQMTLKFLRNLGKGRIQDAMREALEGADKAKTDTFVSYFPEVKDGEDCVLSWAPGGDLDVTIAGKPMAPIPGFASTVFGIWLREKPIQDDIKVDLVSRAKDLIK